MPHYYYTMFEKIDSDSQVKILASGHNVPPPHAGVYLPGAMSERVNDYIYLAATLVSRWNLSRAMAKQFLFLIYLKFVKGLFFHSSSCYFF